MKSLGTITSFESQRWEQEDRARVWQARERYGVKGRNWGRGKDMVEQIGLGEQK